MGNFSVMLGRCAGDWNGQLNVTDMIIRAKDGYDEKDLLETYDVLCRMGDKIFENPAKCDKAKIQEIATRKFEIGMKMKYFEPLYLRYAMQHKLTELSLEQKHQLRSLRDAFGPQPVLLSKWQEYHQLDKYLDDKE